MLLAYWDIRGLCHSIRLLLEYTETPYKEKLYVCGEAGETLAMKVSAFPACTTSTNYTAPYTGQSSSSSCLSPSSLHKACLPALPSASITPKPSLLTMHEDQFVLLANGEYAPDYDRSHWLNEKEKLGLDFPNLPYLIDGDVKLTQSNTILRYIANKHGMCGDTEKEQINISLMENQAMDFRMGLATIAYNSQFETLKGPFLEKLPAALQRFSNFLADRQWFAGPKITFADFLMYDVLDQHQMLEPTCLQNFQNLQDFMTRFEELPAIADYMKSPRFMKTPINNRMALWCNKK